MQVKDQQMNKATMKSERKTKQGKQKKRMSSRYGSGIKKGGRLEEG